MHASSLRLRGQTTEARLSSTVNGVASMVVLYNLPHTQPFSLALSDSSGGEDIASVAQPGEWPLVRIGPAQRVLQQRSPFENPFTFEYDANHSQLGRSFRACLFSYIPHDINTSDH